MINSFKEVVCLVVAGCLVVRLGIIFVVALCVFIQRTLLVLLVQCVEESVSNEYSVE